MGKKAALVLLRHGQSEWNKQNLFTGWVDIPLSDVGIQEAFAAGERISHIPFQEIFVSSLIRAQMTAMIVMSKHHLGKTPIMLHPGKGKLQEWSKNYNPKSKDTCTPVHVAWELNERMYGELQGFDKDEMRKKYGEEQVKIWRRSFDVPPPKGESLEITSKRVIPYFEKNIFPLIQAGHNILISAHGNSLRSIVMFLENLSKEEVLSLEIATGDPLCYRYEGTGWGKESIDACQNEYRQATQNE